MFIYLFIYLCIYLFIYLFIYLLFSLFIYLYSGWWYTHPSEKYEFVSWYDEIPNLWKNKIHVPNHQSVCIYYIYLPTRFC